MSLDFSNFFEWGIEWCNKYGSALEVILSIFAILTAIIKQIFKKKTDSAKSAEKRLYYKRISRAFMFLSIICVIFLLLLLCVLNIFAYAQLQQAKTSDCFAAKIHLEKFHCAPSLFIWPDFKKEAHDLQNITARECYESGKKAENAGNDIQAIHAYEQVIDMGTNTPSYQAAKSRLHQLQKTTNSKNYNQHISQGLKFIQETNWLEAENAFACALRTPGYQNDCTAEDFHNECIHILELQNVSTDVDFMRDEFDKEAKRLTDKARAEDCRR